MIATCSSVPPGSSQNGARMKCGGIYTLTSPQVAELLATARKILTGVVADQAEWLDGADAAS
ncbi:hypothetical protein MYCSP_11990 [Mycobacteroides saopaulense]|nr:hypothetical protein MYCSP_11990 [Mycobacteroides saopaulense]